MVGPEHHGRGACGHRAHPGGRHRGFWHPHLAGGHAASGFRGYKLDQATLFGVDKPSSFPDGIIPQAIAAGNTFTQGKDLAKDVASMGQKLAEQGFAMNGFAGKPGLNWELIGLRNTNGSPIYVPSLASGAPSTLYGFGLNEVDNGAWDSTKAVLLGADWSNFVVGIRQDITYKMLDQSVISDDNGKVILNLAQQDCVAMRVVFRVGFQIANPINAYNADITNPFPFSVYGKAGTVSTVTVSPATATMAKGDKKAFSAVVAGDGIVSENVEWSQSGAKSSISEDGVLTVASNETSTSITVTAKSKQDSNKTGTATVTVS